MAIERVKLATGEVVELKEFWTIPQKVEARQLTKFEKLQFTKNGVEAELTGQPGDWYVRDAKSGKETFYSNDLFLEKFDVQLNLFEKGR